MSETTPNALTDLAAFTPRHDFFVGIDSDGCAFDTMEVKHKECFIPNIIESYGLASVSKYAREVAEFVNLYSVDRGINRFKALIKTFNMLAERPEVQARGVSIDPLTGVRAWVARETKLGNPSLKSAVEATRDADLARCLAWSESVNAAVGRIVSNVPPFPMVRESLAKLAKVADIVVVSATPNEALVREWTEHGLAPFVRVIAGQEAGSKAEVLDRAAASYPRPKTLMIGDAPGDRKAAEQNQVRFYPIDPGHEDASWERFHDETIDNFLEGGYDGPYLEAQLERFEALLPVDPPWKTA